MSWPLFLSLGAAVENGLTMIRLLGSNVSGLGDDTSSDRNKGLSAHFKQTGGEAMPLIALVLLPRCHSFGTACSSCCAPNAAFFVDDLAAPKLAGNRGTEMRLCILLPTQCAAFETALLAAGVVERTGMVSSTGLYQWLLVAGLGWQSSPSSSQEFFSAISRMAER